MIGVILKNMRALLLAYYKRELLCFFCEHNLSKLRRINILWNEAKPMATAQNCKGFRNVICYASLESKTGTKSVNSVESR